MANVVLWVSISLDGYAAGPDIGQDNPLGVGGEALHDWMFTATTDADREILARHNASVGAVVVGRGTFDLGVKYWGGTPYPAPAFVVTHRAEAPMPTASGTFTFVTDGVASAVQQAKQAAGDRSVIVMGAEVARQALVAGLVDRIDLQLVPLLLGGGERIVDGLGTNLRFRQREPAVTTSVTHLTYDVLKGD
jgi:dihydrofolate reductase